MARTPMTAARRATLEGAQILIRAGRIGEWRGDPALIAHCALIAPPRKPAWADATGRALCSLRDWLRFGLSEPMPATVREIDAALEADRTPW